MRRALLVAACCALSLVPSAHAGSTGGTGPGSTARLQGTWTMNGKVTRANNVRGERKGQKVKRKWTFTSSCAAGPCSKVTLRRERSSKQHDKLSLKRSGSTYSGSGKFYVRLRCNGKTYKRGGVAYYTITVRVTKSASVQSQDFATAISASYNNSKRVNKTPCAGSIGRDAGSYTGKHAAPKPPIASYAFTDDQMAAGTLDFVDQSTARTGTHLVSWNWDFGDGSTSTARNPKHHFATGEYDVKLTVQDSNGLTSSITKHIPIR